MLGREKGVRDNEETGAFTVCRLRCCNSHGTGTNPSISKVVYGILYGGRVAVRTVVRWLHVMIGGTIVLVRPVCVVATTTDYDYG